MKVLSLFLMASITNYSIAPAWIHSIIFSRSAASNIPGWPPFCCTITTELLAGSPATMAGPLLPPFIAFS